MKKYILLAFVLLIAQFVYSAPQYNLIDLGPGRAMSISNNSQYIVGSQRVTRWLSQYGGKPEPVSVEEAVSFDITGQGRNQTLWGEGVANSVNNSGYIVGRSVTDHWRSCSSAILYKPAGNGWERVSLSGDQSYQFSGAYSINNYGRIVGYTSEGAVRFNYPSFPGSSVLGWGYNSGVAYGINDNGQIVGSYGGYTRAMLYSGGQSIILESSSTTIAYSINNLGQIVGVTNGGIATLFDSTGGGNNIALGEGIAYSINNHGQIVGGSTLYDPTGNGNNISLYSLITSNGGLNSLNARSINDDGWIVGSGLNASGEERAFLLKPISIPDPATLFLLGLGGMLLRRKR